MRNIPGSLQSLGGLPRSHSPRKASGSDANLSVDAASATRAWGWVAARTAPWIALDWILATYVIFVALVALMWAVPRWPYILGGHAAIVGGLLLLPSRGAAWEQPRAADSQRLFCARSVARFLRYTYPALLLTPFFEEVSLTVNAAAVDAPYWFEHYLFKADSTLFGGTPAVMLSQAGNPVLDEIMHAFYFSYYLLIIGGIVIAWNGGCRGRGTRGRGFHTAMTCMLLGFFLSYVWYPFLPARGPWEHPEVMTGLRPFGGWIFTPAIELIIAGAAVSGGCFPSAHVSGAWAITFGLYATDRRAALWFGLLAVGLSVACVYTRYHHAVDVLAGLTVATVAAMIGFGLTRHSTTPRRAAHGESPFSAGDVHVYRVSSS
jgi:membrane-associated phospholipid phosphatase